MTRLFSVIFPNTYLFHTKEMTEAIAGKLSLENQLRQAIGHGEFELDCQPKMNLAKGRIVGAEALIRWNDPRSGLVPPGVFIPVLEETGLIYEVGRWALGKRSKTIFAGAPPAWGQYASP